MFQYVGIPYSEKNCADLAMYIRNVENNFSYRPYEMPKNSNSFAYSLAIRNQLPEFTVKIDSPIDGCLVLMRCRNRINHIGTVFMHNKTLHVIHTTKDFGSSVVHRLSDLKRLYIGIQGYYSWI